MHKIVHCHMLVLCTVRTHCAHCCAHTTLVVTSAVAHTVERYCARSRALSRLQSRTIVRAVTRCRACSYALSLAQLSIVVRTRRSVPTRPAGPSSPSPITTRNFMSRQTLLSSLLRQRRLGPPIATPIQCRDNRPPGLDHTRSRHCPRS